MVSEDAECSRKRFLTVRYEAQGKWWQLHCTEILLWCLGPEPILPSLASLQRKEGEVIHLTGKRETLKCSWFREPLEAVAFLWVWIDLLQSGRNCPRGEVASLHWKPREKQMPSWKPQLPFRGCNKVSSVLNSICSSIRKQRRMVPSNHNEYRESPLSLQST